MKKIEHLKFNNTYARLPDIFFSHVKPTPLRNTHLISANLAMAEILGIDPDELHQPAALEFLSGQTLLQDMQPIAQCYAGHQFGSFVPRLGDGRAILLGEIETPLHGKWDLQIKGGGPTPYSRDGDGRAVLRSTIREYLCSEAMHGLGIPTTRALCMLGSDEEVYREQIEKGALLLRTAPSHVRFGSFEYFYYSNRHEDLGDLLHYVLEQHFPAFIETDNPALSLLKEVIQRTARLMAQWQSVGFAHGVMNTDNMSILGLTMDYGPFGFLDAYQPGYVCNHSDYQGRYAFDQQPNIGLFNLSCLAQALLPTLDENPETAVAYAKSALETYQPLYVAQYAKLMRSKLGFTTEHADDQTILQDLLSLMADDHVDYTLLFRQLSRFSTDTADNNAPIRNLFIQRERFDLWVQNYRQRLLAEPENDQQRIKTLLQTNPKYILRNYMAEIAIQRAETEQDYTEINRMLKLLGKPYDEHPDQEHYAGFPPEWAQQISVSCSS